jgi:hypothetical protein
MPRGRPAKHADTGTARRMANQRAAARARERGLVQRSLTLPAECWDRIRAARAPTETSDAQTVARLLLTLDSALKRSNAEDRRNADHLSALSPKGPYQPRKTCDKCGKTGEN